MCPNISSLSSSHLSDEPNTQRLLKYVGMFWINQLLVFIFPHQASEMPKLTEQLAAPLRQMQASRCTNKDERTRLEFDITVPVFPRLQECAKRIAKVSADAKLEVDEETYLNQFKPHLMDVIYAWANGATFAQICKMTDVFEGEPLALISDGHGRELKEYFQILAFQNYAIFCGVVLH